MMKRATFLVVAVLVTAPLSRAGTTFSGRVSDGTSDLPAANVYIYAAAPRVGRSALCPTCYRDCAKRTSTDSHGRFTIGNLDPTLTFILLVVKEGFEPLRTPYTDPAAASPTLLLKHRRISDSARVVRGRVVDATGTPVLGAIVEPAAYHMEIGLMFGAVPGLDLLSVTDDAGRFEIRMPEGGTHRVDLRVTGGPFAPAIFRDLDANDQHTLTVRAGVAVSGRVVHDGRAVGFARVVAIQRNRESGQYLGSLDAVCREDGTFLFSDVPPNDEFFVYVPTSERIGGVSEVKVIRTFGAERPVAVGDLNQVESRRVRLKIDLPPGTVVPPGSEILLLDYRLNDGVQVPLEKDGSASFEQARTTPLRAFIDLPHLRISEAQSDRYFADAALVPEGGDVALRIALECEEQ